MISMYHLPQFLMRGNKKKMKQKPRKLDRQNASNNIDYEPSTSTSLSSSSSTASEKYLSHLVTRSLDFPDKTSFRIEGNDGECDRLYRSLGFSGPDDLAIPESTYAAWKQRSASDLLPVSKLGRLGSFSRSPTVILDPQKEQGSKDVVNIVAHTFLDSVMLKCSEIQSKLGEFDSLSGVINFAPADKDEEVSEEVLNSVDNEFVDSLKLSCEKIEPRLSRFDSLSGTVILADKFVGSVRFIDDKVEPKMSRFDSLSGPIDLPSEKEDVHEVSGCSLADRFVDSVRCCGDQTESKKTGGRGGIKGVRPPFLAPPPFITPSFFLTPPPSMSCPTLGDNDGGFCSSEDEDVKLGEVRAVRLEAESYSFTTSNDDDSSSSTTVPTSDNSPIGRLKRDIKNWLKGDLLGKGSFGSVYEGIAEDGFFFAIKEVSLTDQGSQAQQCVTQLEQEIDLLSQFEHENIVQYFGTKKDESNLYIFLELVSKGSLLSLYRKYHLKDSQVSAYTKQILHGLKYLHDRKVVHRDIKCANILVDANGFVKLADFGLAKATKLNDVKSCKGTPFWMAPEVVNGMNQGYGLPADIWSLGCTVLEMLTRLIPYSDLECAQALYKIGKGQLPSVPDDLSTDARDFILQCLRVDPNDRPTACQLLDHPFLWRPPSTPSGSASSYHYGKRI